MPSDTWNNFDDVDQNEFWDTYSRGRPRIPESTWNCILDYHKQHGNGKFENVNDLGSGPGVHAAVLAKHFDHVTLTDASHTNIDAAKAVLGQGSDASKFSFAVGRAEEEIAHNEYDMVFMANALHWTDTSLSLPAIAASLRSGGTFVAMLFFSPDNTRPRAYQAWLDFMAAFESSMAKAKPSSMLGFNAVASETGYDCIRFDPAQWRDVQRVHLNNKRRGRGLGTAPTLRLYNGPLNAITAHEEVIEEEDQAWLKVTDLHGLRDVYKTIPVPKNEVEDKKLWDVLEDEYADRPVEILYRVDMVLATKR